MRRDALNMFKLINHYGHERFTLGGEGRRSNHYKNQRRLKKIFGNYQISIEIIVSMETPIYPHRLITPLDTFGGISCHLPAFHFICVSFDRLCVHSCG